MDHTVVDVDAHYAVVGSWDNLVPYMDDELMKTRFENPGAATIKDIWPKITSADEGFRPLGGVTPHGESKWGSDGKQGIVETMEKIGIDKIVFLGSQIIAFDQIAGRDARPTIYARAYVDYMLDQLVDPSEGIYTIIPLPHQAPDDAAELIEEYADEPGIVAGALITSMVEPPLGDRLYDPIYEAAEKHDLPLLFHAGTPGVDSFQLSGYSKRIEVHTIAFLFSNISQLVSIIFQGIPEKYPSIDFVFQEAGLFYIPMMMYRMDAEYLRKPGTVPILKKLPSEYMKEFYYGTQPMERLPSISDFEPIIRLLGGADRLMYSSDYPHGDWDSPSVITDLPFLDEDEKGAILGGNAEKVFGI